MYPAVANVIPRENFVLAIDFDNGESGLLDMKPYLTFGVFKRLQNENDFRKVKISFDTVEWPIGVDLDPEFVYAETLKTTLKKTPA
jgi:predicted component of type VI protein secretion system